MQAIRYLDLTLPEGRNAKLQIAPEGVDVLHYDSKGDGTFDTPVTPTVSVAGSQAADVDPPTITVGVTRQLSTTVVTLTAQDSGSGVKDLFYSLDGKQFQLYSSPLDLPVGIRVIYAIADDNVGNRSSLMSFDLLQGLDLSGDVNGDGLIDQADLGRLDAAIAGKNPLSKDEFSRADVAKKCGVNTPKELKKDRSAITKYIKAVVKYNDLISKGKHPKPVKIKDQCHANKVIGQPLVAATTTQPASQAVSKKQRIQVFDLTGKLRIDSGLVDSATLTLKMQQVEDTLANGVYLYVITTQEREGPHTLHELRKLVILK
ncbi:hypothetical protein HY009_00360 [Candidatus Acetothermia bacterium]|nr:hypothetical protein [Candidatus Acetothermia bacterium]